MNKNKLTIALLASYLMLCTSSSWAEPRNVNLNYHSNGGGHSENINRNYHVAENNGGERFNNSRLGNSEHFNNDTININRGGYGGYGAYNHGGGYGGYQNAPYRGWNEGPVGMSNGWNSGWNNGNENGGWGMGLMEGIVGGIAATSLFNYFTNHNSTPSYANGGSYYSGSSGSTSNSLDTTPPSDDITNNTTTNTIVNDDSSNLGYWLLGFGVLALGAVGLVYALRRPRRNSFDDEADYGYEEERPRHPRSNSRYSRDENVVEDDYAQIDHQRQPSHSTGARNSRVPQRERRRDGY